MKIIYKSSAYNQPLRWLYWETLNMDIFQPSSGVGVKLSFLGILYIINLCDNKVTEIEPEQY